MNLFIKKNYPLMALIAVPLLVILASLTAAISNDSAIVSTATATVTADSRDIDGEPQAPAAYVYRGVEHASFIEGVFVSGDVTQISVDADGNVVSPIGLFVALALSTAFAGMIGGIEFMLCAIFDFSPSRWARRVEHEHLAQQRIAAYV